MVAHLITAAFHMVFSWCCPLRRHAPPRLTRELRLRFMGFLMRLATNYAFFKVGPVFSSPVFSSPAFSSPVFSSPVFSRATRTVWCATDQRAGFLATDHASAKGFDVRSPTGASPPSPAAALCPHPEHIHGEARARSCRVLNAVC